VENPKVSIIIPCYNHGQYIREAVESVLENANKFSFEIIIINDGSTNYDTTKELKKLEQEGYKILHQINLGLAGARNNGISLAKGKYILPLDSDNKLHKNYLTQAIEILEGNPSVDVVYGNPFFFGMEEGIKKTGEFDFLKIILGNYIDACAVYRKEVWERVKGYDGNMPVMGHEDWEFWISAYISGSNFYYLNDLCFYYRSLPNSMAKTYSTPSEDLNRKYIHQKHSSEIVTMLIATSARLDYVKKYLKLNRLKAIAKILLGRPI
jgi:glycosyltransferase involved in cell wall biosynthesis